MLLAAGVGVCVLGLLAIGFGIPISDTSFGNALLIAGVVVLCTGIILLGMWLAVRELAKLAAAPGAYATRPAAWRSPCAFSRSLKSNKAVLNGPCSIFRTCTPVGETQLVPAKFQSVL